MRFNNAKKYLNTSLIIAAIASSAWTLPAAAGNFYKWTDENGVVHYSERKPESVTETETVKTYNTKGSGNSTLTGTAVGANPGPESTGEVSEKQAQKAPEAKKDPALCERAKADQQKLQRPMVMQNGKVLTIDEKNEQMKKLQEVINVHC